MRPLVSGKRSPFMVAVGACLALAAITASARGDGEAEAWADKLMSYRLEDGGILVEPRGATRRRIVPYFGNFAALGWTETAAVTTDTAKRERYLQAARDWMDWYADNQNPDGTVFDFEGKGGGALEPTGDYDSTDSYPATYAMLMWRYHKVAGDMAYVQGKAESLAAAYSAMMLTADGEGLTYAKPGYSRRFLMDNCEVAVGCAAFARLFDLLGKEDKAATARRDLERVKRALPQFYRASNEPPAAQGTFGFALEPHGRLVGSFGKGYPDAMANLFALTFLADGKGESAALLDKVEAAFWDKPDALDFPQWWLWAAMVTGDKELEQRAWSRLREQAAAPEAHSFVVGLAAATACSGLEALRYDEAVIPWQALTSSAATTPIKAPQDRLAGEGVGLYLNYRGSTSTIEGKGWRAMSLDLPARIDYHITTGTGNVLANVVLTAPWDMRDCSGMELSFSLPPGSDLRAQVIVVEEDGDWWSVPAPETTTGLNRVSIPFDELKPSRYGTGGDKAFGAGAIKGLRVQFDNKLRKPVFGHLVFNGIELIKRDGGRVSSND